MLLACVVGESSFDYMCGEEGCVVVFAYSFEEDVLKVGLGFENAYAGGVSAEMLDVWQL